MTVLAEDASAHCTSNSVIEGTLIGNCSQRQPVLRMQLVWANFVCYGMRSVGVLLKTLAQVLLHKKAHKHADYFLKIMLPWKMSVRAMCA
jgi:hypothetical protein